MKAHRLPPEQFPFTLEAIGDETGTVWWSVTLLRPPVNELYPLRIPPLAKWFGEPMMIRTSDALGNVTVELPK